jgi:hypothetical protein
MPSAKFRQPFLTLLTKAWSARFPEWRRGLSSPVAWARTDATFTRVAKAGAPRFHVVVNFTPKTPGRFTADVVISPTLERLPEQDVLRFAEDISALRAGSYRIGFFGAGHDRWWHLADETLDLHNTGIPLKRQQHDWYASSYTLSLVQIMQEAEADFSTAFERSVLPKIN